jgi:EmrB/QacA subfamily drug resistance transporter
MSSNTATPPTKVAFGAVFAVVAAGVTMSNLDMFIVNVALPNMAASFAGADLAALSWVLNAYAVVFAAWLLPAGSLADRFGTRRFYLAGLALFTLASALCALAPTVWWLVAARVAQAVGAAVLIPSSLGLLMAAAPPERRLGAIRAWTGISGFAAAAGPVLGGLLTEADWRWVFLVNVPIGLVAVVVGLRVLPRTPRPSAPTTRIDLLGAALLTIGIALLALVLVDGPTWGWTSPWTLGALAVAVLLLIGFAIRCARHPSPILPPALLRLPAVGPASLANLLFAVAFAGMLLSIVLWCQGVWGWSALLTGLAIAPGPLLVPFLAVGGGSLVKRFGIAPVAITGCLVFAAGIGWWIAMLGQTPDYWLGVLPGMLLTGLGVGLALPTLIAASLGPLPPQSFATGSGLVTMIRQVGSVFGVALLVAVLGEQIGPVAGAFAAEGFDPAWWLTGGFAVAAALVSLLLPGRQRTT